MQDSNCIHRFAYIKILNVSYDYYVFFIKANAVTSLLTEFENLCIIWCSFMDLFINAKKRHVKAHFFRSI